MTTSWHNENCAGCARGEVNGKRMISRELFIWAFSLFWKGMLNWKWRWIYSVGDYLGSFLTGRILLCSLHGIKLLQTNGHTLMCTLRTVINKTVASSCRLTSVAQVAGWSKNCRRSRLRPLWREFGYNLNTLAGQVGRGKAETGEICGWEPEDWWSFGDTPRKKRQTFSVRKRRQLFSTLSKSTLC